MKKKFLFATCFICMLLSWTSCKKDPVTPPDNPIDPFGEVELSCSIPELGLEINDNDNYVCGVDIGHPYSDLNNNGSAGFSYIAGYNFYAPISADVRKPRIRFHIRGFDEIATSSLDIPTIRTICENFPEQCFANFYIEINGGLYTVVDFTAVPFEASSIDKQASRYAYSFRADQHLLECLDNRSILPIRFEFDGYIYNHNQSDSLKVDNLECNFFIFEPS